MGLFSTEQPDEDVVDVIEAAETIEEPEAPVEPAVEPAVALEPVVVIDDEDEPLSVTSGGAFIDILEPVEG